MKNRTNPVQTYRKNVYHVLKKNTSTSIDIELVPNQFYDYDDPIGLFQSEPEPYDFLTSENIKVV